MTVVQRARSIGREARQDTNRLDPFEDGGAMAEIMRSVDWSATPLGTVDGWPQSLRTALSILNASGFPLLICWGPDYIQLYNDAFRPILGQTKHPAAMGQSTRECFAEIWDGIGPMFEQVMRDAQQTYLEDALFPLDRNGFVEECYFTFSYSPVRDESGDVGGVWVTCIETTGRVLGERRLGVLRELAAAGSGAASGTEAAARQARALEGARADVPFCLVYLQEDDGSLVLGGSTGIEPDSPLAPRLVGAGSTAADPWRLTEAMTAVEPLVLDRLKIQPEEGAPWPEEIERAVVLPLSRPGQSGAAGAIVAGISPRLSLDDEYRGFLGLVAGQVATAIGDARAYAEERRRAEALEELDRAKTEFFSDVSHEFRTPLTLLLGPLESALERSTAYGPELRDDLEIARRNALRLLKLVNTLLDSARIESGRVEAIYEQTDLAVLTGELASVFRSAIERAGLELVVEAPPLSEPVHVDREMWEKVVLNLLSNALKFTFEGRIVVSVKELGDAVEVRIADTGIGIEAEELPRIFDRFHRIRGARSRTHEGTGIGLSLVRELVRLQGGTIEVTSVPGAGTAFTIRVPRGAGHPRGAAAVRAGTSTRLDPEAFTAEASRWLTGAGDNLPAPPALDREASPVRAGSALGVISTRGARVLLADDNADMRDYVVRLLSPAWRVEAVGDGATALRRAREEPPGVVVADVMMPGLDGLELLAALRADPLTADVPVILLSARAGEESRIDGLTAGAADYVVKPFSGRELQARVDAQLQLAIARRRTVDGERSRGERARALATAAAAINAAPTLSEILDVAAAEAREVIGAHLGAASLSPGGRPHDPPGSVSASDRHAAWRDHEPSLEGDGIHRLVMDANHPVRFTSAELDAHPVWRAQVGSNRSQMPLKGWLATPLVALDGGNLGVLQVSDREVGEFDSEDESLLSQLAHFVSIAVERLLINQALQQRERQQAAAARLGVAALAGMPIADLLDAASAAVIEAVGVDFSKFLELLPDGKELRLVSGIGWQPGLVGKATVPAGKDSQAGYTLHVGGPVIVEDLQSERRFTGPQLLFDHGVVSGMSVVVGGGEVPFGVLGAHTRTRRIFTENDVDFLQTVANVVAAAIQRRTSEVQLSTLAAAERTRASELRAVIEAMREGVVVLDASGTVVLRNQAAERVLRRPIETQMDVLSALAPEPGEDPLEAARSAPVERPVVGSDTGWAELRVYPIPDPVAVAGGLLGSIIVVRDVTSERQARTLQDAFISVVSHELRTPITTIYAGSKLLARRGGSEVEGRPMDPEGLLGDIEAEADRLYRLVEDLLVVTRFQRGLADFLDEPVLLQRVLPTVARAEQARWPGVKFQVEVPQALPAVRADPTFVEQIARNLLANAAKYGEDGGVVVLRAEDAGDELIVTVLDDGPGIEADEVDRVFELFYRSPGARRKPGAGIGLFAARRLAEMMGGRIWAKPRPGGGSEFGFALRVHLDEPAGADTAAA